MAVWSAERLLVSRGGSQPFAQMSQLAIKIKSTLNKPTADGLHFDMRLFRCSRRPSRATKYVNCAKQI